MARSYTRTAGEIPAARLLISLSAGVLANHRACSLAHSATNAIGSLTLLWFAGATKGPVVGYGGLLAIPPIIIVCLCLFLADRRSEKLRRN
jgi:hypothetical protein